VKHPFAAAVLLLGAGMAFARVEAQSEPEGFPDPGTTLTDEEFRVNTREFGLDRQVEMYQWRTNDGGYERVWNDARIDSAGFAPGHENPAKMPLENQRWWAEKPTLDGKPLDPAVLRTLGEWRVLHPNFSRLPANLAASFQPEGDGLGSAENPLDPQIGDLRVSWRELVLPPLAGKIELREGVWRLTADSSEDIPASQSVPATPQPGHTQRLWPFFGAGLMAIVAIAVAVRRRRKRQAT
jgi:Transmembrane protein 43